ncbi:AAA family ATPase [Streptomyces sp. NPDC088732]|uniref:helix-turn-helix transcriptional regulator n=1 Tax=Streptomyces sp. NPDC088732 TaxID=3365879 RepID=UPI00380F3473
MWARLFERGKQLDTLSELLGSAMRGRGRVAVINGAVASGKTSLLERFTDEAISAGALVLEASGSRSERFLPFGILRRILDSAGHHSPEVHAYATELLDAASEETAQAADGTEAGMRIMPHLSTAVLRLARNRTVVIAVDDVHHGDELSLHFLLCLARRVRQARVLIVLTEAVRLRPAQLAFHAELQRQPNCTSVRLRLLTPEGTAGVLGDHLPEAAVGRLAPEIHRTTGGNPLLLKALLEDGTSAAPGETFQQAVLNCLHRGDPEMLTAARGVAVLGDGCSAVQLSHIVDLHVKPTEQALQDLERCGVLHKGAFRTPAAREAVLDAAPPAALSALHLRAAKLLHHEGAASLDVARHLVAARKNVEEWAIPVLKEAAEYALVDDEDELAQQCWELAVASCPEGPQRAALKSRLVSLVWRSSPAAAESHLRQLCRELAAGRLADRDVIQAVSALVWMGQTEGAGEALRHQMTAAAPAYAQASIATARTWLTTISPPLTALFADTDAETGTDTDPSGSVRPGGAHTPAAVAAAMAPYDSADCAYVQAAGAVLTTLRERRTDAAVAEATQVLQRYHLGDRTIQPLVFALLTLIYTGRLDLALAWCERLLGECSARNAPAWHAALGVVRAEIALRRGDLPGAAAQARQALSRICTQSWGVGIALPLAILIETEVQMGNHEEAMNLLEQPVPEAMFSTFLGLQYLRARGRCHLATGRYHAALRDFLTCGELMQAWDMDAVELVPWRLDAAEAWLALGNTGRAREYAEQQNQRDTGLEGSRSRGALLLMLARTGGDLTYRLKRLTEAVDILEVGEDRLQFAVALGELGRAYRALGDFNRARILVRKAWHVAKSCGAEPLCVQFMPGGQAGPEPAEATGRETAEPPKETEVLSEAEARVALLAARGHTNREIATKLYVTVSTVEQHLTRIYRKLQVKRRRDLPARLSDLSLTGAA